MGGLIRIIFPLIGYVCVATVVTTTAGYSYLRRSGAPNDENMFQIVSLLHGVDLDAIAKANEGNDSQNVPPEEMSSHDRQQQLLMNVLHLQAKKDDIEKNITVFKAQANELDSKFRHFERFRDEVKSFLDKKKLEATASGIVSVRDQWKTLKPKQTKQLLIDMVNNGQMNTVIELLNGLPAGNRKDILKTMDTPEDLKMLLEIEQAMLAGGAEAKLLDQRLQELEQQQN